MKISRVFLPIMSVLACMPAQASDQVAWLSGRDRPASEVALLQKVAGCIAERDEENWIGLFVPSAEGAAGEASVRKCVAEAGRKDFSVGAVLLSGALAEQFYRKYNSKTPTLNRAPFESFTSNGRVKGKAALFALADCVVRDDSNRADALLRTIPRSPEEAAILPALVEDARMCPASTQVKKVNAETFRASIAEMLFRRSLMVDATGAPIPPGKSE